MKKYRFKKIVSCGICCLMALIISACGEKKNSGTRQMSTATLVKPEGVEMSLPGSMHGTVDEKIDLIPGNYVVKMTKDGSTPVWERVTLKDLNEEVTPEKRPIPVKASALIKSEPSGAEVYIDGEKRGVTPCVVSNLERGVHKVMFRKEGYDEIPETIEIFNAEPRLIEQNLSQNTGTFVVEFEPADAEIYINGKRRNGFSPLTLTETAGTHKLEIKKEKYESIEEKISIQRGGEMRKAYVLNPLPGSLTVHVTYPAGATITLDGREIKNGQPEKLKPGKYKLHVSARGFDAEEQEFQIAASESKDMQIALQANTGKIILPVNEPHVTISIDGKTVGMTQPDPKDPDSAEVFEISGVPAGTYKLSFWHPNTPKTEERTVTVSKEKREVRLPRIDVWLPNANVTMQGRVYKDCRITPVEGTNRVKFVYKKINSDGSIATVSDEIAKSSAKIDYFGDKSAYAKPEFKSSRVDLLTFEDNLATITINDLRPGCEISINGKKEGIARSSSMVLRVKPDSYTIRISHKYGKNVKKPNQNYVENTKKLVLARGGNHTMKAPGSKVLWISDTKLILKNGGVLVGQVISENENNIVIQTEPGEGNTREVALKDIARKEILD